MSREAVARYSIAAMVRAHVDLYEEVLARPSIGRRGGPPARPPGRGGRDGVGLPPPGGAGVSAVYARLAAALVLGAVPALLALAGLVPGRAGALTRPWRWPPSCGRCPWRVRVRVPAVTPRNIVWGGFALHLGVAPLLLVLLGPVEWVFPVEQSWAAIQAPALLAALAFACWALGVAATARPPTARATPRPWPPVPSCCIWAFAVRQSSGSHCWSSDRHHGGLPSSRTGEGAPPTAPSTWRGCCSGRFLTGAGIALLSNAVGARARGAVTPGHVARRAVACAVLVVLSYGTLEWRRAPLLAVLFGLLAAGALILGRPRLREALGVLVAAGVAFFAVRVLRSPDASFDLLFSGTGSSTSLLSAVHTEVQAYAGGLQMTAFLLDHIDVVGFLDGRGQLHAALAPMPLLGEGVRDETPTALFNALF